MYRGPVGGMDELGGVGVNRAAAAFTGGSFLTTKSQSDSFYKLYVMFSFIG